MTNHGTKKTRTSRLYGHRTAMYTGIPRRTAVAKITWLGTDGKPVETQRFYDGKEFLATLRQELDSNPSWITYEAYEPQVKKDLAVLVNALYGDSEPEHE